MFVYLRRILVVAVAMVMCLGLASAPAYAWGDKTKCAGVYDNPEASHTNRWSFFAGHHMDVYVAMCYDIGGSTTVPHLDWTRTPVVTFPSRFNPAALLESVAVTTAPFVIQVWYTGGKPTMVRYKYTVTQKVLHVSNPVTFDFTLTYSMLGSRICVVGGTCDDLKGW